MLHHLEVIHNATQQSDDSPPLTHSQPSDLTSPRQSPFDQCVNFIHWDIITIMSSQAVMVKYIFDLCRFYVIYIKLIQLQSECISYFSAP